MKNPDSKTLPEISGRQRRSNKAIFQRIAPGWDHDLHIHSNWSQDNLNGPAMVEYASLAERYKVHIGFADHFELLYGDPSIPKDPLSNKLGEWRLTLTTLEKYLEEIDQLKSKFPFISSGLEIDFYPQRIDRLQEFTDDYRNQFDLLIGSVHELEDHRPVTVRSDLEWLIHKYGSFDTVIDRYFQLLLQMVDTQLFDVIAHPDVIYRFLSTEQKQQNPQYTQDPRVLELGKRCFRNNSFLEINLSGLRYAWGQSFPAEPVVMHLQVSSVPMIIGSDSHSLADFSQTLLDIRKYNRILR